jgi:hypothetical protein|tara:strand:- start:66701 stop:67198 length:498 start_codon:yes stop_codon:yes gene_type:complete
MSKNPSANIVDNSLVLSLPNALNPVVWRMELAKAKMSAIEIREDKIGDFALVLKTPKGDSNEIARFGAKSDALKGLNAITSAMLKAEKTGGSTGKSGQGNSLFKKFMMVFAGIICCIVLFIVIINIIAYFVGIDPSASGNGAALSNAVTMQDGVPQSADDFLKAQ